MTPDALIGAAMVAFSLLALVAGVAAQVADPVRRDVAEVEE